MGAQSESCALLAQLVDRTLAGATDKVTKDNLFRYALRLLDGKSSAALDNADEGTLLLSLKQGMQAAGAAEHDIATLQELCTRLTKSGAIGGHGRASALRLLLQLYKDAAHQRGSTVGAFSQAQSLPRLAQLPGAAPRPLPPLSSTAAGERRAGAFASQPHPAGQGHHPRPPTSNGGGGWIPEGGGGGTIAEPHLVRDVLYACQAVEGRYSAYSDRGGGGGGGYDLRAGLDVDPVQRGMVNGMAELGWLFRKVSQHVASSRDDPGGAVRQALAAALQAELRDFYRLLAVLETQSGNGTPTPNGAHSDSGGAPLQHLTLLRLTVWLKEPLHRMRLLARLADSTAALRGGALAGAIYQHTQHGSPFDAQYVGRILAQVSVPLFDMIRRWVFEGELQDGQREFFVVQQGAATAVQGGVTAPAAAASDLWRDGYALDESQRPPFIGLPLAGQILRAGKSINFLQQCCGDAQWVQDRAAAAAATVAATVSFGKVEELEVVVQEASSQVDARLLDILLTKFQWGKHCDALRRYLLLSQGDTVQALMDLVSKELDLEASKVSEISLNHSLRAAISQTNARFDDEDVLERLRAKRDKPVGGGAELGWDVFSLQYDIRGPLAAVFSPAAMARYGRVFQLLWRLKRVEGVLAGCWSTLQCEAQRAIQRFRRGPGGPREQAMQLTRMCLRLRGEMSHFVTNLQHYLNFEVLEGAYGELQRRVTSDAGGGGPPPDLDLDGLLAAHDEYLATILRKALLDEGSQDVARVLNEMLTNMIGLAGAVNRFNVEVQSADRRLAEKRRALAAGTWGTVQGEEEVDGVPTALLKSISARVAEVDDTHIKKLADFTTQLPAQTHDEVRFLLYRLDFTQYYRRTLEEGDDPEEP